MLKWEKDSNQHIVFWSGFCVITLLILMWNTEWCPHWGSITAGSSPISTHLSVQQCSRNIKGWPSGPFFTSLAWWAAIWQAVCWPPDQTKMEARVSTTFTWNYWCVTFHGMDVFEVKTEIHLFLWITKTDKCNLSKRIQYFQERLT